MQNKRNLLISAGGTGGHIIPALTIGLSLKNINPIFICGKRDIEKTVYENFNVKPVLLNLNSFSFVSFILSLPKNIMTAVKILIDKNPQSVIIAGNYTSVPVGIASVMLHKRLFAIEQDALIGKANKVFAKAACRIFTAYEPPFRYIDNKKAVYIGHVIRDEVRNPGKKENDITIETDRKKILIMGGSQGALTMTKKIIEILSKRGDYHLIVIAGKNLGFFEPGPNATLLGFYKNMGYLYSIADLIIARSGALSVAEIASTNKPAVFIPLSTASNNEQRKNVEALMKKNPQFEILDEYKIDEDALLNKIKRVEVLRGANKSAETVFKKQISIIENYV